MVSRHGFEPPVVAACETFELVAMWGKTFFFSHFLSRVCLGLTRIPALPRRRHASLISPLSLLPRQRVSLPARYLFASHRPLSFSPSFLSLRLTFFQFLFCLLLPSFGDLQRHLFCFGVFFYYQEGLRHFFYRKQLLPWRHKFWICRAWRWLNGVIEKNARICLSCQNADGRLFFFFFDGQTDNSEMI